MLIFDSRFENANLRRAIKVNNVEYNLWLENDVNTKGHTQWFYFKVIHRYPKSKCFSFPFDYLCRVENPIQHIELGQTSESILSRHEDLCQVQEKE